MKLAIIDLDGIVADNTARFAKAEEAKQAYLNSTRNESEKKGIDAYWQTAFTPELVSLDTLIPGADVAISKLELADYDVVYLTSRPESMRQATWIWLFDRRLSGPKLIMKAPAFQYTKTTVWKAGMVQTLANLFGAGEVLFIDDEQANIDALYQHGFEDSLKLHCYTSLAEAHRSKR